MLKLRSRRRSGLLAGLLFFGGLGQASAASFINAYTIGVAPKVVPIRVTIGTVGAVPELSKWVMLLVGFFGVGAAVRCAKSVSA